MLIMKTDGGNGGEWALSPPHFPPCTELKLAVFLIHISNVFILGYAKSSLLLSEFL